MADKMIKIKWIRSAIGRPIDQRKTLKGLGFKRLHQTLLVPDRPEVLGMIRRICHLVEVMD
ncbi:MAG: 50S ribosomal protein L30 [Deltaproteobacteria bacterium RBG_13_47_9]|nr:MAG: 50S ribosomal protein L30 [Deltaproteobacteria bacterium RBG_13_47_9]